MLPTYPASPYSLAALESAGFVLAIQRLTAQSYAILLGPNGHRQDSYFGSASLRLRSRSSRPDLPRS